MVHYIICHRDTINFFFCLRLHSIYNYFKAILIFLNNFRLAIYCVPYLKTQHMKFESKVQITILYAESILSFQGQYNEIILAKFIEKIAFKYSNVFLKYVQPTKTLMRTTQHVLAQYILNYLIKVMTNSIIKLLCFTLAEMRLIGNNITFIKAAKCFRHALFDDYLGA